MNYIVGSGMIIKKPEVGNYRKDFTSNLRDCLNQKSNTFKSVGDNKLVKSLKNTIII